MAKKISNVPGLTPKSLKENKHYTILPQNNATNQMARLNTKRNAKHLPMNQSTVSFKDVTALFSGKKLRVAETQLLDYIVVKHGEINNHDNDPTVTFTLKEYMQDRGLKDAKSARSSLRNGLDKLVSLQLSYSGGSKSNPYNQSFGKHNLFTGYDYTRGTARITFTPDTNKMFTQQAMPMPYHKLMFRLDPKKDATAWYILRKLLENKRMNFNQGRADKMKIATLLKACPNLPSYEEVMDGNRHVDDRIIQPFFKAVERLSEAFSYTFLTVDGKPFNYGEGIEYSTFAKGELVITQWNDYPETWIKQIADSRNKHRKAKKK